MAQNKVKSKPTSAKDFPVYAREVFSAQEIQDWVRPCNWAGLRAVVTTWGMIMGSMGLLAFFPNVFTFLFALVILGGRHLALAILMHEAAHDSLFRSRIINDFVGQWLCAYPTWQDLTRYREHHLRHHRHAGTKDDPDGDLVASFPVSKTSFARKILRDLTGVTGFRRVLGLLLMDFGFMKYTVSGSQTKIPREGRTFLGILKIGIKNLHGVFLTNLILALVLYSMGVGWIYGMWVLSYLLTFSVFVRIRSMAEHACTFNSPSPLLNTRTTTANWLARVTVAPHRVNFHLEHHLLMRAPHFRLPLIHQKLREIGLLEKACVAGSYREVINLCTT